LPSPSDSNPIAANYFVINGTVHAASDHEVVGSSAFPNYATGAIDNYYSMALSHVDNSPFAQGTASPADTGPIGQTAAAGNTQQTQYADARWPGKSGKATYGSQGQPYATAEASEYKATAESSVASSGLTGPSGSTKMATPTGFDDRLRQALAGWKAKWQGRLLPKTPTGAVKAPTPTPTVTTPTATVTTPAATVTTPTVTIGGLAATPPPVSVPSPAVPPSAVPHTATPSRSTSSASTASGDGASLLESSTLATLDDKTKALVTSGESRLGRVSLGGGQIVIQGIHVSAAITNDGTPTEKVAVSVGAASIGGVPVTIDQDGVHVSGQGPGLPYQQASDALNGALKQAGIQLFIVTPEIKKGSCDQTGTATGTTTTTLTNSSDRTGTNTTTTSCDQPGTNATTTSCGQTGTTTTTTTSTGLPVTTIGTTTTNSSKQTGTTTTTSSCDQPGTTTTTSSCDQPGTTTTTTSSGLPGTTTTTGSSDGTGTTTDTTSSTEETVRATGLHVVFTQPVQQSGVPAQYVEHILGEVFLNSLAVPAGALPNLNLSSSFSSSSSCPNGRHSGIKKTSGALKGGGGSSSGGSSSSSSPSASISSAGSSQPTSGFTGSGSQPNSSSTSTAPQSFPARFASALRKPMWLLLAYLLWQALVIATGVSLRSWQRGGAS
jgi:hypothetical protein